MFCTFLCEATVDRIFFSKNNLQNVFIDTGEESKLFLLPVVMSTRPPVSLSFLMKIQ